MPLKISVADIFNWMIGIIVFTIGFLNIVFVHPVPGNVFMLLSFLFFPPVSNWLLQRFNFRFPQTIKFVLAFLIIWFTLGVSDLGDMIDKF
jgi:hypothetical protein